MSSVNCTNNYYPPLLLTLLFVKLLTGQYKGIYELIATVLAWSHVGSYREVACSASDRQGSNFESCVWRTVSSQSSHHPQEVLLAQFSLYVHKGCLKPDSFHFCMVTWLVAICFADCHIYCTALDYIWFLKIPYIFYHCLISYSSYCSIIMHLSIFLRVSTIIRMLYIIAILSLVLVRETKW